MRPKPKKKVTPKPKTPTRAWVGQEVGGKAYKGFKPDKLNKTGYFELYSELMEAKKFPPLPTYMPIPEHEKMGAGDLILTTYKVAVQIHSRSANCKWLTEIYHDNPAMINPLSAKPLGIKEPGIRSESNQASVKLPPPPT